MNGEDFKVWLAAMRDKYGYNKQECGQLMGHTSAWVTNAQKVGVSKESALACTALLAGLTPFTSAHATSSRPQSAHRAHA
jgi:hypothetical protein